MSEDFSDFEKINYRVLQKIAKQFQIRANQKRVILITLLCCSPDAVEQMRAHVPHNEVRPNFRPVSLTPLSNGSYHYLQHQDIVAPQPLQPQAKEPFGDNIVPNAFAAIDSQSVFQDDSASRCHSVPPKIHPNMQQLHQPPTEATIGERRPSGSSSATVNTQRAFQVICEQAKQSIEEPKQNSQGLNTALKEKQNDVIIEEPDIVEIDIENGPAGYVHLRPNHRPTQNLAGPRIGQNQQVIRPGNNLMSQMVPRSQSVPPKIQPPFPNYQSVARTQMYQRPHPYLQNQNVIPQRSHQPPVQATNGQHIFQKPYPPATVALNPQRTFQTVQTGNVNIYNIGELGNYDNQRSMIHYQSQWFSPPQHSSNRQRASTPAYNGCFPFQEHQNFPEAGMSMCDGFISYHELLNDLVQQPPFQVSAKPRYEVSQNNAPLPSLEVRKSALSKVSRPKTPENITPLPSFESVLSKVSRHKTPENATSLPSFESALTKVAVNKVPQNGTKPIPDDFFKRYGQND